MKWISDPGIFQKEMEKLRRFGRRIGFVPTMGALHEGHRSLIRHARRNNDITVVSIFVNPTQFGPQEDLSKYPRTLAQDKRMLRAEGVDFLFLPGAREMYPEGFSTSVHAGEVTKRWCGLFRPGHFDGVATVVAKLFQIVKPHRVYFGAKDYQQAVVIQQMIRDLNFDLEFRLCETVRESDGLALSSRNRYLRPRDRRRAAVISQTLFEIRARIQKGEKHLNPIRRAALKRLEQGTDKVQYLGIVDPVTLRPLTKPQPHMVALCACFVGKTRLIDNVIIRSSR